VKSVRFSAENRIIDRAMANRSPFLSVTLYFKSSETFCLHLLAS
jgi:hypothetical protein